MEENIGEECGIFGGYGHPNVVEMTRRGLFQLQHRGQESVGISSADGYKCYHRRRVGLVSEQMTAKDCGGLKGHIATGHVRYSTAGGSDPRNIQPLPVLIRNEELYSSENGNICNYNELKTRLENDGSIFTTTTDVELIHHLIAKSKAQKLEDRIIKACNQLNGAYSLLFMTDDSMIGVRDPRGIKPMILGKKDEAYFIASESPAFDINGIKYIRDVEPGEMLIFNKPANRTKDGYRSRMITENRPDIAQCIFEMVYFRKPHSMLFAGENLTVWNTRVRMGEQLFDEHPVEADIVGSVPDSGNNAAQGFAHKSGIMLGEVFVRNHYTGRTFILPGNELRKEGVDIKLGVNRGAVAGKRVVIVDDSIVRGNTTKTQVSRLREYGAKEIHVRISCPPVRHPCFYGMDFPTSEELIANKMLDEKNKVDVDQLAHYLGADSLGFLSLRGLLKSCNLMKTKFCSACFDGKYPTFKK